MINWIRENAAIVSIAGSLVLGVSGVAVARYQLSGLVEKQSEIEQHMHDTTRHLDPNRDPERLKKLEERVEQLERQLRWMERRQQGGAREWEERRRER